VITPESVKRAVVASIAPQADLAGWSHVLDVNPGRTLLVLLADGSQITGAFVKADAAVLTLKVAKGERDIPQASVKEVRIQTKHIRSGTIAAIAMIAAGAVISLTGPHDGGSEPNPAGRGLVGGVIIISGCVVGAVSSHKPAPVTEEVVFRTTKR